MQPHHLGTNHHIHNAITISCHHRHHIKAEWISKNIRKGGSGLCPEQQRCGFTSKDWIIIILRRHSSFIVWNHIYPDCIQFLEKSNPSVRPCWWEKGMLLQHWVALAECRRHKTGVWESSKLLVIVMSHLDWQGSVFIVGQGNGFAFWHHQASVLFASVWGLAIHFHPTITEQVTCWQIDKHQRSLADQMKSWRYQLPKLIKVRYDHSITSATPPKKVAKSSPW